MSWCSSSSDAGSSNKPPKFSAADETADILKEAKEIGSPQQAEALADKHITVEEMKASLDAYDTCLESSHWRVVDVLPDPIRGEPHFIYSYGPDRPDRDMTEADDCAIKTYRFVDVFAQTIQGSGPMDPALRARTQDCLDEAGVRTSPDDRTDVEIFMTAGPDVQDVRDCLLAAYKVEFPGREEPAISPPYELWEE